MSTSRPVGFAAGAIPWDGIAAYCEFHGIANPDDRDEFFLLIRAMDAEYLSERKRKE